MLSTGNSSAHTKQVVSNFCSQQMLKSYQVCTEDVFGGCDVFVCVLLFRQTYLYSLQFFSKENLDIPKDVIEGTIHCKPGAASALLERMYKLLTHRE